MSSVVSAREFEKELTQTDVGHKLTVPARWLDKMPRFEGGCHEVQFGVLDDKNFHWPFCCSIRKEGYLKPVLQSEGWLRFVTYKGLKVGDKIIFHPEVNDFRETIFKVRAQRRNIDGHWVDI